MITYGFGEFGLLGWGSMDATAMHDTSTIQSISPATACRPNQPSNSMLAMNLYSYARDAPILMQPENKRQCEKNAVLCFQDSYNCSNLISSLSTLGVLFALFAGLPLLVFCLDGLPRFDVALAAGLLVGLAGLLPNARRVGRA